MIKHIGFWRAASHLTYHLSDIRIDAFVGAHGTAEIVLPVHTIYLLESSASTVHTIGSNVSACAVFDGPTLVFIPKNIAIICSPVEPFDVLSIAIPDHWFAGEMRGRSAYDDVAFEAFETIDPIMIQVAFLLKSIAAESPPMSRRDSIDALVRALARRSIRMACHEKQPIQQAVTAACLALVKQFVDTSLSGEIRLLDLAEVAGMSQFHFSRAFKVAMNETPMRYVLGRRIAAAKLALSGTGSLIAIAHDAGFASQSHFTTSFRQATGETPAVWRAGKRLAGRTSGAS